jgi:hypothetical protein
MGERVDNNVRNVYRPAILKTIRRVKDRSEFKDFPVYSSLASLVSPRLF